MQRSLAINGRFLTQPLTGIQRYCLEILTALDRLFASGQLSREGWEVDVIAPRRTLHNPAWKEIRIQRSGPGTGHLWEQMALPMHVGKAPFITLSSLGPRLVCSTVAAIHDIAFITYPRAYSGISRFIYSGNVRAQLRNSKAIITGSNYSKAELVRVLGADPGRITVIPHGVDHIQRVAADPDTLQKLRVKRPYILVVGTMTMNKNVGVVSRAVARIKDRDFDVLVIGGDNRKVFAPEDDESLRGLTMVGRVTDRDLRALYANALCFVFPSLYEGFGLPPLEAMACGCPVICSNATSLPEVCGSAAEYFDPHDDAGLASVIDATLRNSGLRASLRERGLNHAKLYSWAESARRTWELIRRHLPD